MTTRVRKQHEPVDPDDHYVMSRDEDRSMWAKTAYVMEKYKLLIWIGTVVLVAFGFDFKTPAMAQHGLQAQIDTLRPQQRKLEAKLDILLRLQCMNRGLTDRERQLAGLSCSAAQ